MLAEDLEQEAREATLRRLQEDPNCTESHLVVKAKEAIYKYRRRGSSVDGKLYPEGRDRHYRMISLQEAIDDEGDLKEEFIGDPRAGRRPTEQHACIIVLFDDFRGRLSAEEERVFTLRLTDTSWEEIGGILDQGEEKIYQIREGIEGKALMIWERPEDVYYNGRREKRPYTRTPNLPEEVPPELLDVLTRQERIALAAYREGATQEEAAKAAGISQPTVSRVISFVWENNGKPPEEVEPRTWRYKNDNRREQVMELFYSRPPGELATYEELLELFSDVADPWGTMWKTVSRYNSQLEGAEIRLVKGEGYALVEEKQKNRTPKGAFC